MIERVWRSDDHSWLRLLPQRLGVENRGRTKSLERAMTWLGAERSFESSVRGLKELFGFELPTSTLRNVTLEHAAHLESTQRLEEAKSFRSMPSQGANQLIAQADGSMIATVKGGLKRNGKRPRDWNKIRLVSVQAVGAEKPLFAASFESVSQTANQWEQVALKAGRGKESQVHIVGDGASWICQQSKEVFGDQGKFLVDFYHVSEYLGAASKTCRPSNPSKLHDVPRSFNRTPLF